MNEQSSNIVSRDDYPQGSRFDSDTQIDLHTNTVPNYDIDAIRAVHEAYKPSAAAEEDPITIEIRRTAQSLANLQAVRRHALGVSNDNEKAA